jgi:hypothetical protein
MAPIIMVGSHCFLNRVFTIFAKARCAPYSFKSLTDSNGLNDSLLLWRRMSLERAVRHIRSNLKLIPNGLKIG